MQRTTPGTSGSDYYYFMVSGVVGGGRQDKNLSHTSLNTNYSCVRNHKSCNETC